MAQVIATVETWPPLDVQQQEAVAALFNPSRPRHR